MRADILSAYEDYLHHAPNLGELSPLHLTDDQREALIHAFEVATNPLIALRVKLTVFVLSSRCASCGISETSELDHYLPKEHHPQFAILSRNLVPICSTCNRKKAQKLLVGGTNVRCFLHLYFDNIPSQRFLAVEIQLYPKFIDIEFKVCRPNGMDWSIFQHLKSHVAELDLVNRYRKMALLHMSDERGSYRRLFETDQTGQRLSDELAQKAEDHAITYGFNYWLSVLNAALAENAEFCCGGFTALEVDQ